MNVGFIIGGFPTISETFILNQITGLITNGKNVFIFPKYKVYGVYHNDVYKYELFKKTYFPKSIAKNKLIFAYITAKLILKYVFLDFKNTLRCFNQNIFGEDAKNFKAFYSNLPYLGKRIDIIQVHYGEYLERALYLKKLKPHLPIFLMMHLCDLKKLEDNNLPILKNSLSDYSKILVISDYSKSVLLNCGIPKEKLITHHVGIDLSLFTKEKQKKSNQFSTIISVGRLEKIKGHIFAIQAIHKLIYNKGISNIVYKIIGGGSEFKFLIKLTNDLKIEEHVIFLGPKEQTEIIEELSNSDIYLHPSLGEVTPLAIMEAMAMELPVIATDVGAVNELVFHNETGLLIKENSVESILDSICVLLANKSLSDKLGKNARQHIFNNYNIDLLNKKLIQIYLGGKS